VLKSEAYIDRKLMEALDNKKDFNERKALKLWIEEQYSYK
jgi:hypothetical protein